MEKIRILIVDDMTVIREGLMAILSFFPDLEVVGQAEDGLEAVEKAAQRKAGVLRHRRTEPKNFTAKVAKAAKARQPSSLQRNFPTEIFRGVSPSVFGSVL